MATLATLTVIMTRVPILTPSMNQPRSVCTFDMTNTQKCTSDCNHFSFSEISDVYAKAFTVVTDVLGAMGMSITFFSACDIVGPAVIKMCGLIFLLCTLFEGLTLLILRSNICTETGFFNYVFTLENVPYIEIESVNCTLTRGSNLAVGYCPLVRSWNAMSEGSANKTSREFRGAGTGHRVVIMMARENRLQLNM